MAGYFVESIDPESTSSKPVENSKLPQHIWTLKSVFFKLYGTYDLSRKSSHDLPSCPGCCVPGNIMCELS